MTHALLAFIFHSQIHKTSPKSLTLQHPHCFTLQSTCKICKSNKLSDCEWVRNTSEVQKRRSTALGFLNMQSTIRSNYCYNCYALKAIIVVLELLQRFL